MNLWGKIVLFLSFKMVCGCWDDRPQKTSIQVGMSPNMNEATLWRGGIVICSPGSWLRKW